MRTSGWCSAPDEARPMCGGCRVLDCEHECHGRPVVERESRLTTVAFGAVSRDNMSTALTANKAARATAAKRFPGPTITTEE